MSFSNTRTAQALFFLNALIWLAFGSYTIMQMLDRYPGGAATAYVLGILMLGNVGAMLLSGILLTWQNKWYYFFAVFVLLINLLLTITDQFGLFDLITLLIDFALLGILISIRKRYLCYEANP